MKIGIDISQMAYEGTGVANYLTGLVEALLKIDQKNEYILFFSSMRRSASWRTNFKFLNKFLPCRQAGQITILNIQVRNFKIPPLILDILWNRLHIVPIEWLIGDVDVFISSDWTQPPTKRAKKATILYDLIVYKYPKETAQKIVNTQKRRLNWVKKECDVIFCISEATKRDAMEILEISEKKLKVIYPGV